MNLKPETKVTSSLDKTGIIGAILAASGWGMAGIFIQLLPSFSALSIVAVRLSLALVVTTIILLFPHNLKNFLTQIKELRRLTVWGLSLIMLICYTFGTIALQIAPVGEVTLLMTTAPIFVILVKLLLRSPIKHHEYWGALIVFSGICFVIFPSFTIDSSISRQRIFGNLLALSISMLFAIYAIWFHSLSKYNNAPTSMAIAFGTFILGSVMLFPAALQEFSDYHNIIKLKYLMIFLGLGLVSTAIPTLSCAIAAKRLPPLMATSVLLLEPIFALTFAFLILGEIPSIWIVPGIVFVITGLLYMG